MGIKADNNLIAAFLKGVKEILVIGIDTRAHALYGVGAYSVVTKDKPVSKTPSLPTDEELDAKIAALSPHTQKMIELFTAACVHFELTSSSHGRDVHQTFVDSLRHVCREQNYKEAAPEAVKDIVSGLDRDMLDRIVRLAQLEALQARQSQMPQILGL